MKAKIGLYEIDHAEGFKTIDEAVKFVLGIYPELDKELVRKNVKSLVNGNQSKNTTRKVEKSEEPSSEIGKGSVGG